MKPLSIIFIMLFGLSSWGQTLDDYVQMAITNSPGIKAKKTEYQSALQKLPQAKSLPDPQVSGSFFFSPMMLPMGNQLGSLSAMQMFPWPGTLDAMEKEASSMAEVKKQSILVTQNDLVFKVKSAWYPMLELEEKIQIMKANLKILETEKELAVIMFQNGMAPMVDAIRADIMIDEMKTEISLMEQMRKPLVSTFNKALSRAIDEPVNVTGILPNPDPAELAMTETTVDANPALHVMDRQAEAAKAEEVVAETMSKPMFGAGLQYMPLVKRKESHEEIPPNTGRDMIMPMFTVTVPIWKKKYSAAIEERRLMQTMFADMKQDMKNDMEAMVEMTIYEMDKAVQMIALYDSQVEKTQQAIDLMLAAYANAGKQFEEILLLQMKIFRYQAEKVTAKAQYQLARVKLEYLTGSGI